MEAIDSRQVAPKESGEEEGMSQRLSLLGGL